MTVSQLYEREIQLLPEAERLQLASQILLDIATPLAVDFGDEWTEEDKQALTAATSAYGATSYPEQDDLD